MKNNTIQSKKKQAGGDVFGNVMNDLIPNKDRKPLTKSEQADEKALKEMGNQIYGHYTNIIKSTVGSNGSSPILDANDKSTSTSTPSFANVLENGYKTVKKYTPALQFNAGKTVTSIAGIKTLGDLANIDAITQVMIIIIAILFFMVFWWGFNKLNLNKQNCTSIEKTFDKFPYINNINPTNPNFKYRLRDYYIKTAYNCCASGNFKNDFVNLCALKNCIKQGARCLDFEIYSIENVPVIAASSSDSFNVKESYNNIPFAKAMEVIATYAFSTGNCPNPDDPLILHFRIKSSSQDIQDAMANALYNTLEDRLLGPDFSYENNGLNIGAFPIANLMGKVVIIVDKSNPIFTKTNLNEYVNLASNSAFMRSLRYKDVQYTQDKDELIFFNKQNMTICLPDLSARNKNYSSALAMSYGCQMNAMSFQNFDDNLKFYVQYFDDAGSAFVLREERLRYIPTYIPEPKAQDPAVSFGTTCVNPLGPNGPKELEMCIESDYGGASGASGPSSS